jgi:hypothetical protein
MSCKTGESGKDRIANLAIASVAKDVQNIKSDSEDSKSWGNLFIEGVKNWDNIVTILGGGKKT